MKKKLLLNLSAFIILFFPTINFGQTPNLGTAADFVVFSSVGAVGNAGISHLTGNIGTNIGAITGFGNVDGVMHNGDGATAQCSADLLIAYNQLNTAIPTFFPASLLGNGSTLNPGVYSVSGSATLNLDLTLNGQGNPNAVFIFQIQGPLSTNAFSKIILINGTKACNVFWKVEGLVSMASETIFRGTIIANNAAINMSTGVTLEGRALSTAGAINADGILAYTPIGCGSLVNTGPMAPALASVAGYGLFSSNGSVTNAGVTHITGDVGTNNGLTTGFNSLFVTGTIHPIPDASTAQAALDLTNIYNYLNTLSTDIELLYPAQFGNSLVLTPHTYLLNAATIFTDTLFLNAQGNADAVFVIKIKGALSTSTFSKVVLINGAQAKNIYWNIDGAVSINDYSNLKGTIISNNGVISFTTGATLDGRAFTTTGALTVSAITVDNPACYITTEPIDQLGCIGDSISFSVVAPGSGLGYQWRKGNMNLVNGVNISGATSSTLTINPVSLMDTSSTYNVVVSGLCASQDTSINVALRINSPIIIASQPIDQSTCADSPGSFSVLAVGKGLTYQWKKGATNLIDGGAISGATSANLVINPAQLDDASSDYYVVISGACAPNDTSQHVSLLIETAPNITTEPINQLACAGDSVSFIVVATGIGLTYQWRKGTSELVSGGNIIDATAPTLVIHPVDFADTASTYNVIVSGGCYPPDTSMNVSLKLTSPNVLSQPTSKTICAGDSVSFSINAIGTNIIYQWRRGTKNLVNGGNISGANSPKLSINPTSIADSAYNYNVIITGVCSATFTSQNVALNLNTAPSITTEPSNQIVCATNPASISVITTGTNLTYRWRKGNINLVNGENISGATSSTLTINSTTPLDTASNYNVIVSGLCTPNDTSKNVSIMLYTVPQITTEPINRTICSGQNASFLVGTIGDGLTYQWRKGLVNLVNGGNVSGVTSSMLTINPATPLDAASNYNVIVSGTCVPKDTSINISLLVNSLPIAVAKGNSPICTGSPTNLTAQTSIGATYMWTGPNGYSSLEQNPVIPSSNATTAGIYSLTTSANNCISTTSTVTVVVNNCGSADLKVIKIVDNTRPAIGQPVVFTITASNSGTTEATGVSVTDILPNGYNYVSSTTTQGSYNSATGIWVIGDLNNGSFTILTLTATVKATGNYVNTATISGNEVDPNVINNTSSTETFPTPIFIPEGFSPNGDGVNDVVVIRGIDNYPNNTLTLFNRWGNKVLEQSPYRNTWDGTSEIGLTVGGTEPPVATYFYIFNLGDGSPVIKGTIYLNR